MMRILARLIRCRPFKAVARFILHNELVIAEAQLHIAEIKFRAAQRCYEELKKKQT